MSLLSVRDSRPLTRAQEELYEYATRLCRMIREVVAEFRSVSVPRAVRVCQRLSLTVDALSLFVYRCRSSASTNGHPSALARAASNVHFPLPDTPCSVGECRGLFFVAVGELAGRLDVPDVYSNPYTTICPSPLMVAAGDDELSLITWESSFHSQEAVSANHYHKLPTQFCLFLRNALCSRNIKRVPVRL